jgi:flagellar biosynthesis protein FliQ
MAHGGIRYLENGEFRLVREAVQERNRLIQNAPHLVKPLPTTIPIFKTFSGLLNAPLKFLRLLDKPSERGALVIKIGLMLSLPIMIATLVVGIFVSIVQSITSIQEQTMVFVPKIIVVFVALLVCFSWMMNTVINYTQQLLGSIPDLIR